MNDKDRLNYAIDRVDDAIVEVESAIDLLKGITGEDYERFIRSLKQSFVCLESDFLGLKDLRGK